jgi:hypothetical protein
MSAELVLLVISTAGAGVAALFAIFGFLCTQRLPAALTAQGATLKIRNTTRVTEPGKLVSEQFIARKDAPEKLVVRVDAKKR